MFNFPLGDENELDPLLEEAAKIVIRYDRASASLIQRRLSIGYARSARILDQLEQSGVVGPSEGAMARKVLITSLPALKKIKSITKEVEWPQISYSHLKPDFISLNKKPVWLPQLSEILRSKPYSPENFLIGQTNDNKSISEPLNSFPNLLIVGNPDSHKETFLDSFLLQGLLNHDLSKFKLIIADFTGDLNLYNGLPHLLTPIITEDFKTQTALMWVVSEMQRRQKVFTEIGVRNLTDFNQLKKLERLPYIFNLLINPSIDSNLSPLLETLFSSGQKTGIVTLVVLNRASYKQIPADLKSVCPGRLVFQTTTATDSRLAGVKNAQKLSLGQAIFKNKTYPQGLALTVPFVSDKNVTEIIGKIKKLYKKYPKPIYNN